MYTCAQMNIGGHDALKNVPSDHYIVPRKRACASSPIAQRTSTLFLQAVDREDFNTPILPEAGRTISMAPGCL